METPETTFAEAPDAECYPDLVESGTLAHALRRVAEECGVDLGEIRPGEQGSDVYRRARLEAGRGPIWVKTALHKRNFLISLTNSAGGAGGWGWPEGGTASLDEVVEVVAAWQGGIQLIPFGERFPFMRFSRMAVASERGTLVETAWDIVLTENLEEEGYARYREMAVALHSDPRLRRLFPFFSHVTLRLKLDPYNLETGGIYVDLQDDGRYSVRSEIAGPSGGAILTDVSLPHLADAVVSLL
jgi:hypothetical protein